MVSLLKKSVLRARSLLHRAIFSATKGRVLNRWGGLPVVRLTTTGRRTGRRRTTMLVSPLQAGNHVVLVASNGGAPRHPEWFLNLQAHPEVVVVMADRRGRMRARIATSDQKAGLWPRITTQAPSYARYQERTTRDIPLVLLEPLDEVPS